MEEYRARGMGQATIKNTGARLDRWGRWLKQRRPRVPIERIDADLITHYMASRSSFRAKSTVYGTLEHDAWLRRLPCSRRDCGRSTRCDG